MALGSARRVGGEGRRPEVRPLPGRERQRERGDVMAYESTTVAVEKSQGESRGLLPRHGAARFAFGEEVDDAGVRWAAVTFSHAALLVRIRVPHKPIDRRALSTKLKRARSKDARTIELEMNEQEARRIWRVMAWNLKARLI